MAVSVMAWVFNHSQSAPTQRLVLLAIADCANDRGAEAYPSMATLSAKTGLSVRGVRNAVVQLETLGELRVEYKGGPHGCNRYAVLMVHSAPRAGCTAPEPSDPAHGAGLSAEDPAQSAGSDSAPRAGYQEDPAPDAGYEPPDPARRSRNPAPRAPKPLEPSLVAETSVGGRSSPTRKRAATTDRGTRVPDGFEATTDMITWARANTPLVGAKETAAFVDYWRAKPGKDGRKLDWLATWRNWMRRAQRDAEAARARGSPPTLVERDGLRLKPETVARLDGRSRFEAMDKAREQLAIEGVA